MMISFKYRLKPSQFVAMCVGATLGLLCSIPDISNMSSPPPQVSLKRRPIHDEFPTVIKDRPFDPNDGIIVDSNEHISSQLKRSKSSAFKLDTSALGSIVNPHPYKYTIDPKDACKDPDLFLVAYVHTAADHITRRHQIRKTWGDRSLYKDVKFEVYFIMGSPQIPETQKYIELESEQYKDIVQEDFVDAYHNLSIKAVGAMRWVSTRCKQAKYVLKTDDDVFINTFTLIKHLKDLNKVGHRGLLMCLVWTKMHVSRDGKWKIPEDVIKDKFYPPYCSGMGYVMSMDIAKTLYVASMYIPFFWVDDVYITGMVPKAINLTHVDISRLFMGRKEVEWLLNGPDWYKYIFSHLRDMPFYTEMWKKLTSRAKREQIPDMKEVVPGKIAINYGPRKPSGLLVQSGPRIKKPVLRKNI